jgi:hypothetical protein
MHYGTLRLCACDFEMTTLMWLDWLLPRAHAHVHAQNELMSRVQVL